MEEMILREDNLATRIYFVRGEKVMADFDLAMLYGVETAQLKRAVRRNLQRFHLISCLSLPVKSLRT